MLTPRSTRSPLLYLLLAFVLFTCYIYWRDDFDGPPLSPASSSSSSLSSWARKSGIRPANATLGFGGIFAVSGPGSPRRPKLQQAAAVTEIKLTIPDLPQWSDEDVRSFRPDNEADSRVLTGSVKAWLSHHVVLRAFLDSGLETALIIEDDVDWDIHLRTQQIPLAQLATRDLAETHNLDTYQYPWGMPDSDWELMYVGHCGDYFGDIVHEGVGVGHHHPEQLNALPHVQYTDPSLPYRTDLHPFTASLLTAFSVPEQTRVIHKSQWPLCSFGYAVTRKTAHRLLTEIAPPKEDPRRNLIAYDAAILDACRDWYALKCWTVTPELFHHMEGQSLIAMAEEDERKIERPPVDAAGIEQVRYRRETSNIGCGFWSGDFYYGEDKKKLVSLRDEVGRKGKCNKYRVVPKDE